MNKDVHTEHCCAKHGCKYGEAEGCSVESGRKPQSFPCEVCECESESEINEMKLYVVDFGWAGGLAILAPTREQAFEKIKHIRNPNYGTELTIEDLEEVSDGLYRFYGDM